MGLECILSRLAALSARRVSPEWGCGGIFGLTYTGEVLFYTVAFDAVSYFHHFDCSVKRYGFELIGSGPRSGGDTYNAAVSVDDRIYFGGWVHAPAAYRESDKGFGEIVFSNKYSHVHVYDASEKEVKLLWAERGTDPRQWVGEVTDLLYNPVRDTLLVARGDGHVNLGVYEIDRGNGSAKRVSPRRVLRGTIYMDHACFTMHHGWGGSPGVLCLSLENYERGRVVEISDVRRVSVDNGGLYLYRSGDIASLSTWLISFIRGGMITYDPFGSEEPWFTRLLDFHYSPYGPLRSNALGVAGGLLVAFSASTHATIVGTDELPVEQQKASRTPPAPTLLVYVSPSNARIVAALGARVTSMALAGPYVLVATSTCPNLERYDAVKVDHGEKSITVFGHDLVNASPPPVTIEVPGWVVEDSTWGGIPLTGYKEALMEIRSEKSTTLDVFTYTPMTRPGGAEIDRYDIEPGRTVIDLSTHRGLVASFRLLRELPRAAIRLVPSS